MDISTIVPQIEIFSHLSVSEARLVANSGVSRKYAKNEWIVYQGDIWPYLFFVLDGNVNAVKESLEGRRLILETIEKGEVFWGLAFFLDDTPMPAGLNSSTGCELALWSRQHLYPLLRENSQLSWEISRSVIRRALRASEIVDELAFQPVAGRLARFLIERFGDLHPERVARNMTLEEMAAHIGTTREVVCRVLQRFANNGLIEITRTEFIFTDQEGLSEFAQRSGE